MFRRRHFVLLLISLPSCKPWSPMGSRSSAKSQPTPSVDETEDDNLSAAAKEYRALGKEVAWSCIYQLRNATSLSSNLSLACQDPGKYSPLIDLFTKEFQTGKCSSLGKTARALDFRADKKISPDDFSNPITQEYLKVVINIGASSVDSESALFQRFNCKLRWDQRAEGMVSNFSSYLENEAYLAEHQVAYDRKKSELTQKGGTEPPTCPQLSEWATNEGQTDKGAVVSSCDVLDPPRFKTPSLVWCGEKSEVIGGSSEAVVKYLGIDNQEEADKILSSGVLSALPEHLNLYKKAEESCQAYCAQNEQVDYFRYVWSKFGQNIDESQLCKFRFSCLCN